LLNLEEFKQIIDIPISAEINYSTEHLKTMFNIIKDSQAKEENLFNVLIFLQNNDQDYVSLETFFILMHRMKLQYTPHHVQAVFAEVKC